ncbi:MAG TPA: hypothetical protein DEF85_02975 [Clostridiaceae bacterium]|jgi:hypothetical protein|nr:hypothetical protein [Clostridiaceae bacterium]HBF77402.1 hypothetical protein [Clostridiaceae bacterium]HBN29065.1 hypothetical protein [Clostridiaceae bacterium]HBX47834.1 hypothetical protein [Clostridiaceae bacterium]HCL50587.1 hypothetical protein [Clostridiaceae bacterium]
MKGKDFLDKMEFIDDKLIENASKAEKSKRAKKSWNRWAVVAACLCVLFVGCTTVNAATDGKFVETIKQWFTGKTLTNDIVTHKEEVYAKKIVFCNEKIVVFADELGAVVYDYKEEAVLGAINLQEIQCNYINAETIKTQFLSEDGEKLWIYNEKNGEPDGEIYEFDLSNIQTPPKDEVPVISPINILNLSLKENLSKLKDLKDNSYSKYVDAFSKVPLVKEKLNDGDHSYSKFAYVFKNENGQNIVCMMVISGLSEQNQTTELCFYNLETNKYEMKPLNIQADKSELKQLPDFEYTGSDEIMKAVCDYLCDCEKNCSRYTHQNNAVYIPYPIILKVDEKDNKVNVYGNFYSGYYELYGNQLNNMGGGESPAIITFQREADGSLRFVEIKKAGEGDNYAKDIKEFCKGIHGLYEEFMNHESIYKKRSEVRIQMISEYEKANHLGIEYIKDYGWDPIKINK